MTVEQHVQELIRTNNPVLLNFIQALLKDADIFHTILDTHMSIMEGSIGILPQRIMVPDEDLQRAKRILEDADINEN